jgi:vacuolar protein sorting-associated protein 54
LLDQAYPHIKPKNANSSFSIRLLADAEFFRSRISKIDGSGNLGDHIVKVVQAKTFVEPQQQSAAMPSAAPNATTEEKNGLPPQNGTTGASEDAPKKSEAET